jgi:hypothetical protein
MLDRRLVARLESGQLNPRGGLSPRRAPWPAPRQEVGILAALANPLVERARGGVLTICTPQRRRSARARIVAGSGVEWSGSAGGGVGRPGRWQEWQEWQHFR